MNRLQALKQEKLLYRIEKKNLKSLTDKYLKLKKN